MEFSIAVSERSFLHVLRIHEHYGLWHSLGGSRSRLRRPRNSSPPFSASRVSGTNARTHSSVFRISNSYDAGNILSPTFLLSLPSSARFSCFRRLQACLSQYFFHTRTFNPRDGLSPPPDLPDLVFVLKMGDISWISQGHLSPKPLTSFINYLASRTRINKRYGTWSIITSNGYSL